MAKNQMAVQLAAIREKHPDWYVWYVLKGRDRAVWFAGRPSSMIATYEAQSADELDADLSETLTSG